MAADRCVILLCLFSVLCCVACELNLPEDSPCITKGFNGTCVNVFRCPTAAFTYVYTHAGFPKDRFPVLPDICSYNDNEPVVCCTDCDLWEDKPFKNIVVGPFGKLERKGDSIALNKCYEYFEKLPYRCRGEGPIEVEKVWIKQYKCHGILTIDLTAAGGRDAERWELPHMALLGFGDDVESAQWLCGGTVISERFILTAAHCTYTRSIGNISFAALGLLKRSDPKENWKIYKIKRIINHPEYKDPSKYHDIALLETETEIAFGKDLLPACLNTNPQLEKQAESAGWGQLGNRQALADTLQVVNLEAFEESECRGIYKQYRNLKHGYDHEKQMCYGSHSEAIDTCQGDSGGPLQYNEDLERCRFSVIGVTSNGKQCGTLGLPGVYTRVSYYVPWIESIVWPEETEAKRKVFEQQLAKLLNWS